MSWDRTDQRVEAVYLKEYKVTGTVVHSRVKYGGIVQHTIELDQPLNILSTIRDRVLVDEHEILSQIKTA